MKKFLLSLTLLFSSSILFSQTQESSIFSFDKGDFLGTLSLGFNSTENDIENTTSTSLVIAPEIAYFITEHIAAGLTGSFNSTKKEIEESDTEKSEYFSGGIFGRYYIWPERRLSIFGELGANYYEVKNDTNNLTTNTFEVLISPGINFFLSERFVISTKIGALNYTTSTASGDDNNITSYGLNLNPENLRFGFAVIF